MPDEVILLPRDEQGEVKEAPGAPPDEAAGEAQKAWNPPSRKVQTQKKIRETLMHILSRT